MTSRFLAQASGPFFEPPLVPAMIHCMVITWVGSLCDNPWSCTCHAFISVACCMHVSSHLKNQGNISRKRLSQQWESASFLPLTHSPWPINSSSCLWHSVQTSYLDNCNRANSFHCLRSPVSPHTVAEKSIQNTNTIMALSCQELLPH